MFKDQVINLGNRRDILVTELEKSKQNFLKTIEEKEKGITRRLKLSWDEVEVEVIVEVEVG